MCFRCHRKPDHTFSDISPSRSKAIMRSYDGSAALAELATNKVAPDMGIHLSHTELENLEKRRRALRQQIVQKRIEYRRRSYALQTGKSISLFSIFCSCWNLGPRFSWLVQDIIEGLDTAGETERLQLYEYYVKMTEDYEVKARRAGWWLYHLQTLRTTFNIILPAVLALQNVSDVSQIIMWLTWGLSLAVSLATGYIDLFRMRDNYEMYTRACEHLKLEGWQFFALTGRYAIFDSHQKALHIFLMRVAKIRKRTIDREFPPQSGSNTGMRGGASNGGGGDGGVYMGGNYSNYANTAAPSLYSNSNAQRSPNTMQSQPSTSSSERPVPPRSRAGNRPVTVKARASAFTPPPQTQPPSQPLPPARASPPLKRAPPSPHSKSSDSPETPRTPTMPPQTPERVVGAAVGTAASPDTRRIQSRARLTLPPPPPPPPGFTVGTINHHHEELATAQLVRSRSIMEDSDDDSGTDKDISM